MSKCYKTDILIVPNSNSVSSPTTKEIPSANTSDFAGSFFTFTIPNLESIASIYPLNKKKSEGF